LAERFSGQSAPALLLLDIWPSSGRFHLLLPQDFVD
jgi:hypothetical protein